MDPESTSIGSPSSNKLLNISQFMYSIMVRIALFLIASSFSDAFTHPYLSRLCSNTVRETLRSSYDIATRKSPLGMSSSAATLSSNEELLPGIDAIGQANEGLYEKLSNLRENAYFRLYSVDILASCEYMPQELFECYSETCEIYPVDEDEVRQLVIGVVHVQIIYVLVVGCVYMRIL